MITTTKSNLAIFASGNGSNAQAIIDACKQGIVNASVAVIITDKAHAFVVQRAIKENIPYYVFKPKTYSTKEDYEADILKKLQQHQVDFIALAGYMRLIGSVLLSVFPKKIVNIHPSLLPKYPGLNAIQQTIDNNDYELGVTIHYVDAGMDTGEIIRQEKVLIENLLLPLNEIAAIVHALEHKMYISVLQDLLQ